MTTMSEIKALWEEIDKLKAFHKSDNTFSMGWHKWVTATLKSVVKYSEFSDEDLDVLERIEKLEGFHDVLFGVYKDIKDSDIRVHHHSNIAIDTDIKQRIDKLESSKYILANADDNMKGMIALYVKENQPTNEYSTRWANSEKLIPYCVHCGKLFNGKRHLPNIDGMCDIVEKPKDSEIIYAKESFLDLQKMLEQQKIIIGDKNKQIERMESYREHRIKLNDEQKEEIERLKSSLELERDKYQILLKSCDSCECGDHLDEAQKLREELDSLNGLDKEWAEKCAIKDHKNDLQKEIIERALELLIQWDAEVRPNNIKYMDRMKEILEGKS